MTRIEKLEAACQRVSGMSVYAADAHKILNVGGDWQGIYPMADKIGGTFTGSVAESDDTEIANVNDHYAVEMDILTDEQRENVAESGYPGGEHWWKNPIYRNEK